MDRKRPSTCLGSRTSVVACANNPQGRVLSLYGTELQRYTSFRIHPPNDGPVRQLLFHDKGIIALGPRTVHMAMRRGLPMWNIRYASTVGLRDVEKVGSDMPGGVDTKT
jgi:PAB-dependent poly(A)-specific ribonuclease subunit 2